MTGGPPRRPLPSLRYRRLRALALLLVLAALVTAVMRLADAGPDRPEAAAASVPAVAALTPAQSLETTLAGADGRLSVAVADLQPA